MSMPTPQMIDSVIRTVTTSLLSLGLVGTLIARAVTAGVNIQPTYLDLVIVTLTSSIISFYIGSHASQNTAALEEARQREATRASEASADRSEAAAVRKETPP